MKKSIFFIITVFFGLLSTAQNSAYAPNFTCDDCNGTNTDLYTQIDAGKVIVVCWVMPCSSCVPATKTTYNVVQSYQTSNPNKVFFYLCDDYGDISCSSLNSWANGISVPSSSYSLRFSNSLINMTNYGSVGMPKITVIGGSTHEIFYNANGSVNGTALQNAIGDALNATGIEESKEISTEIILFPNPVNNSMNLSFSLNEQSTVNIDIYDLLGQKVYSNKDNFNQGVNKIKINTNEFIKGIYFIKISDTNSSKTLKFNVTH